MAILFLFLGLQLCDAATTMVFLRSGVTEGNPLIAGLMAAAGPAPALAAAKLAACAAGVYAWKSGRIRLLRRANIFFTACVAWNLLALALA